MTDAQQPAAVRTPEAVRTWLTERVADYLDQAPEEIGPDEPLIAYGLDSVYAVVLCGDIERDLGLSVEPVVFWEVETLNALSAHLVSLLAD